MRQIGSHSIIFLSFALSLISSCRVKDDLLKSGHSKPKSNTASSAGDEIDIAASRFYAIWKKSLEKRLAKHAPSAGSARIPYSGSWYPEVSGGTDMDGALAAYDRAFKTTAAAWERNRDNHFSVKGDLGAEWAGHCNGFSAAASRHKEPMQSAREPISGEVFTPKQIKALLAEIYMSPKALFLGGLRCEGEQGNFSTNPFTRNNPERKSKCEDINPASFHLALTNWIGVAKHPIIMDVSLPSSVWNYPVYKYACTNCASGAWKRVDAQQAMTIIGGSGTSYIFNPAAKKFADVTMSITYSDAFGAESINTQRPGEAKVYRYILELNDNDEIIGGEWAKENRDDHPDFVWVSLETKEPTGDNKFANPHVDAEKVLALWRLSINDPNASSGIMEPVWEDHWGKFTDFHVKIDGGASGAVFLGKKTKLEISLASNRFRGADLEILLNDKSIKSYLKVADNLSYEFDSPFGLNQLIFRWKDASAGDSYRLRYFAIY